MDGTEIDVVVSKILTPIGTKRRTPAASFEAYQISKLKIEPDPYFYEFDSKAEQPLSSSTWTKNPPSSEEWPINFTGSHGPIGTAKSAQSELDAFSLFIDNEMVERIVYSTNISIEKFRRNEELQVTPLHANTCTMEVRCFLGLLIFRGLHRDA